MISRYPGAMTTLEKVSNLAAIQSHDIHASSQIFLRQNKFKAIYKRQDIIADNSLIF